VKPPAAQIHASTGKGRLALKLHTGAALPMKARLLFVSTIVAIAMTACGHRVAHHPTPGEPASATAATQQTPTYRPRHQGAIDIGTGLYMRDDDDLFLETAIPVVLRRTYMSGDGHLRRYGMNSSHSGEWWLSGDSDPSIPWANLNISDGRQFHFTRISPGRTQADAVLRHDDSPTEFNGALLVWTGSAWELRLRDGSVVVFKDCQGEHDVCSLIERRDADGHRAAYVRDESGRLLRIESQGQTISFEYDAARRITKAYDSNGHSMSYVYDARGRLTSASASDGTVRLYSYDATDRLIRIREPGRIVENWFDGSGRVIRQEVRSSDDDRDPYVATVRYEVEGDSVVQVDFDEGYGVERERFDNSHFVVAQTFNATGSAPVTFTYHRDPTSHVVITATMSCTGHAGPTTRPVRVAAEDDDGKWELIREMCIWR
jgi:Rhs family protein